MNVGVSWVILIANKLLVVVLCGRAPPLIGVRSMQGERGCAEWCLNEC